MAALAGLWSHLLAAALYGALALVQLRRWRGDPVSRPLITAFAVVSVWSIFAGLLDPYDGMTLLAESARDLAFLAFMYGIMREGGEATKQGGVKAVYAAVAAVIGLQIVVGGVIPGMRHLPGVFAALAATTHLLGLTIAAGALILVHNLYGQAAPASRGQLRYPMLALAAMWAFDLHLYTVAYFMPGAADDLFALRGLVLVLLAPLFALALRDNPRWRMQLSRAATFQSVSLFAILLYLIVMMSAARALEIVGGDWARAAQIGLVAAMTLAALVLLPSARARGWLRVFLAKHVFEHRYDYRAEWLRFTDTVGRGGGEGATLEERVVKGLADIAGAPGGMMLLTEGRRLSAGPRWSSTLELAPAPGEDGADLIRFIEADAYVIDFGAPHRREGDPPIPAWLAAEPRAWAGVPLIHSGRLVGLVILEHPAWRRALDWEDYDLFRAAGIQAASYIAEARGQQALADSRRFDEFNRRFAFILHDIKNLVSQLSLVARNAERHADNPEFRADMIATLQASVRKMNDLLARLSPGAAREGEPPRDIKVRAVIDAVARAKGRAHPVRAHGDSRLIAHVAPAGLEQALAHLVQNAIDASGPDTPVEIHAYESGGDIAIEVIDRGPGMSPDFVAHRLFQPFASTKETGFGIGAYEARELIRAMGGRLEVESAEGEGTRFTLILRSAETLPAPQQERMRA
jgi:putative PEP-CTERM system histidine kinase